MIDRTEAFVRISLKVTVIFFFAIGATVLCQAQPGNSVEPVRISYTFPAYASVDGIEFYADQKEYEDAIHDPAFVFEKLRYKSDGLSLVSYLYRPAETRNKKYPLIIFLRGSVTMGDAAPPLMAFFHRLASQGFIVLAPQYRGSDGGEGHDEVGGSDLDDVFNVIPLMKSLGFIDEHNVFLYGQSRGGMMTYQAIRDGMPVNAAAVFGAFTDLEIMNQSPYVQKLIPQIWPDYDQHKQAIIERRSAKYWPEKLSVPLLIMNGGSDPQVDASQPLALAQQLQALKKNYSLVIYANGDHHISADRLDRDRRAVEWFQKHMKK